jgi:HEAT repeat protein
LPRRGHTERALEALDAIERDADGPGAHLAAVRRALGHASSLVAARAARIAGRSGLRDLEPDLVAAFVRLCAEPGKADPGCKAKEALVAALERLEHTDPATFRRGLHHVQHEPVFGGSVDTAAPLRCACMFALVRLGPTGLLGDLAEALADPEPAARAGAARALGAVGGEAAEALLRLRLRSGDTEPGVLAECLLSLLHVAPEAGVASARALMAAADPDVVEAAALACAESRVAAVVEPLKEMLGRGRPATRAVALRALALLRHEDALAILLTVVREDAVAAATAALDAMAAQEPDERVRRLVHEAVMDRSEPEVLAAARRLSEQTSYPQRSR